MKKNENLRTTANRLVLVSALLVAIGLAGVALTPTASAAEGMGGMLVNYAPALLVIGGAVGAIGFLIYKVADENEFGLVLGAIGAVVLIIAAAAFAYGAVTDGNGGRGGPPPPPDGIPGADWECNLVTIAAAGPGTLHDAVTEFPDAPFIAADGGSPDLNKVIATPIIDFTTGHAVVDLAIVGTVATTAVSYINEDAYAHDIQCFLTNPQPAVAGGNIPRNLAGRVTLSRTSGTNNNGSYGDVFYCDTTAGMYVGLMKVADSGALPVDHDADHSYVGYSSTIVCPGPAPLVGDWRSLGSYDGTDPDGVYVGIWYVLHYGISDYTSPPIGTNTLTMMVEIGSNPNGLDSGDIETVYVDLRLLSRT